MQNKFCWNPCEEFYLFPKGCIYFLCMKFELKLNLGLELFNHISSSRNDLVLIFGYVVRFGMCSSVYKNHG
jgi:hypothetical protein